MRQGDCRWHPKGTCELAVHRPPAGVLPLLGRFDGREEVDEATRWLDRFATELKPFYDDWLPKRFTPRQVLELTKIPYVAKFSFGEPLPVVSHGVRDPDGPGFYLANVTALLASDFREATQLLAPSEGSAHCEQESERMFELLLGVLGSDEKTEEQIGTLVKRSQELVSRGYFEEARKLVHELPDAPAQRPR